MNTKLILAAPCLALLAACGGISTGSGGYSDTLGSPSEAFGNGLVLKATEATAAQINLDWTGDRGERVTELEIPTFSLEKSDGNIVIMKVNGLSYEFTNENRTEINEDGAYYGLVSQSDDFYVQVYSHQGTLSEFIDGSSTRKSEIIEYMEYNSDTPEDGVFGIAVLGAPTNPTALGDFTTITYGPFGTQNFRGETTSQDGFVNRQTRFELRGDTTLTANFEQNTISGEISDITFRNYVEGQNPTDGNLAGSILLNEGVITGSGFRGVAAMDETLKASADVVSDDMEYSGNFYGNQATEASGVLQGTIETIGGSQENVIGSFRTLPVPD